MSATTAEVLRKAADLIEPDGAWTQGTFGRFENGLRIPSNSDEFAELLVRDDIVCRCALGAIVTAYGEHYDTYLLPDDMPASEALADVIGQDGKGGVAEWNDAPGRTQAEVVTALRAAAERAEKAGV